MIIVIDGYNLLKSILPAHTVREEERRQFLKVLGEYAKRKNHELIVVFDGGPYEWPSKEIVAGMKVVYSGRRKTADDVIRDYLDDYKTKEVLLVSSDNALGLNASRYEIPYIASADFYLLLKEALREPLVAREPVVMVSDKQSIDLDTLMHEAGANAAFKQDDLNHISSRQRASRQSSKMERILLQRLKKL